MNDSYPICAKNLSIDEQCYTNIDEQAECLTDYDQKYYQISPGKYSGMFSTLLIGNNVGLYFEKTNQTLEQWAAVPANRYAILILMNGSADLTVNGSNLRQDNFHFLTPNDNIDATCPIGTNICVINFDKNYFEHVFKSYLTLSLPKSAHLPFSYIENNTMKTQLLRHRILEMLHFSKSSTLDYIHSIDPILASLQDSLINITCSFMSDKMKGGYIKHLENSSNKLLLAKHSREIIREQNGKNISVRSLVKEMATSRRSIEYAFRREFGISPADYIKRVQLNEIRTELRDISNNDQSIGNIVAPWGIWHLGRFAEQYKNQFGELPSETRCRPRLKKQLSRH